MAAYLRPTTLDEALALRAARDLVVLAGGTDVYPAKATRAGWGDLRHGDVLDISAIAELRGVAQSAEGWRIGALATWTELMRAPLPALFDGLKLAAREVGGVQIQNRGTLAGNLCNASPAADGVPCLLTLDAEVEIASIAARRRVPLARFIDGYRHTVLRADELVTAIHVPPAPAGARGHFVKLGARRYLVISIAMVAGVVATDAAGAITDARLAVGSCSAVAQRLPALERALIGAALADATRVVAPAHLAALAPIDDVRASGAYRAEAAVQLARDLLADLAAAPLRRAS